jgi:hypothetical protein
MIQPAFRYFDHDLEPGQVILPQGDHFHNLSADKQKAEAAIRAGDPRGSIRSNAVFVFEKREIAEALLNETPGEHLYELLVEPRDILNRSDLRIYDEIVEALKAERNADALVRQFWEGVERDAPRVELTVAKAVVRQKLIDDDEK